MKGRKRVIKISIPYIYGLSGNLKPLRSIAESAPIKDSLYALYSAEYALNAFLTQSVYSSSLRATSAPGMNLQQF
jgi:hypothetical protein